MDNYITLGTYAACVGLFCIIMLVFLVAKQKSPKAFNVWLASGVTGVLLGATGLIAAAQLMGYEWHKSAGARGVQPGSVEPINVGGAGPGPGGPMGGGAGGKGPGGGGGFQPSPTRDLATLVRKLDLLTGDIAITLTQEQKAKLKPLLAGIQAKEQISDEAAPDMLKELKAVLSEAQQAALEKVGLPRTPGGPRGGGAGSMGGNPFKEGAGADAMKSLVQRLH